MSRTVRAVVLGLCLLPGLAGPSSAQQLRFTTSTDVAYGGPYGQLMGMMGGDAVETSEVTVVDGSRVRTDSGDQSVIWDYGARRFVTLDHQAREYAVVEFDRMAEWALGMAGDMEEARAELDAATTDARAQMDAAMEEARREAAAEGRDLDEEMERFAAALSFSVDDTGDRRRIHDVEARRVLMQMEYAGSAMATEAGEEPAGGTMVLLTELWLADELFPEMASVREAQEEMGREAAEALAGFGEDLGGMLGQVYAMSPDLRLAMERRAEALGELGGHSLESTTYLVMVPPGTEFDRETALAFQEQDLSEQVAADLRGAAADAARDEAADAVKKLRGRLGGLFSRRDDEEEAEEEAADAQAGQVVVMRIRNRVTDVSRSVDPAAFEIPEGYAEREMPGSVR